MNNQDEIQIAGYFDSLSAVSRYIRMYYGQTLLASGTCFFVMSADGPVLVTNRHNFTGRNNVTGKPIHKECGIPDNAIVTMHDPHEIHYHIDLADQEDPEEPAWTEHPTLGDKADIVALPVKEMTNMVGEINSISLEGESYKRYVGSELNVIGYPYGQIGGPFPIWSKGSIASEPDVDIAGLPVFLIDCRSRPGQSGSPVFTHFRAGEIVESEGQFFEAKRPQNYFVGVYSGRLRSDSDLGLVWKKNCVDELVKHAINQGRQHRTNLCRHQFPAKPYEEFSLDHYVQNDVDEVG